MERLTEYHCGVAVIKNKALLPDAMKKLAAYEDECEKGSAFRGNIESILNTATETQTREIYYLLTGYMSAQN